MSDPERPLPDADTIACVGDSAIWGTGTRWEDKAPNLVHKTFHDSPIPPANYRARGGAVIGRDIENHKGYYEFDRYDAAEGTDAWYGVYDSRPDEHDINENRWTVARDIGSDHPTILHQLEHFPSRYGGGSGGDDVDVPSVYINQLGQKPDAVPPDAEDVDLLILNGGTNDISLETMNNPLDADRQSLWYLTKKYCYIDLFHLIKKARARFPNATIAVVGYYPFTSNQTDRDAARRFLDEYTSQSDNVAYRILNAFANGLDDLTGVDVLKKLAEVALQNGLDFARFQSYWMRRAVAVTDQMDRQAGNPGIAFVPRGFGLINSMEAQVPWCWGSPPEDDIRPMREPACVHDESPPELTCLWAAIGHPNRRGNRKTAAEIVSRFKTYEQADIGTRLVRMVAAQRSQATSAGLFDMGGTDDEESMDISKGTPLSVRDTLERYSLDPSDGLRYCHNHTTVDSIRLTFETGRASAYLFGRVLPEFMPTVDLIIEPGRTGSGERYRVSNTYTPPDLLEDAADIINGIDAAVDTAESVASAIVKVLTGPSRSLAESMGGSVDDLRGDLRDAGANRQPADGKLVDFGFEHYDKFQPESTDTICIDPMHGRHLADFDGLAMADQGPGDVRPGDDWSVEPLRLEHIQSLKLGVDLRDWPGYYRVREQIEAFEEIVAEAFPEDSPIHEYLDALASVDTVWELQQVEIELNGHISNTIEVGELTESTTIDLRYPRR